MGTVVPLQRARSYRRGSAPEEPRLTGAQLRAILGVSDSTLKRWRRAGMPYERWSERLYRYSLSDVLAWRADRV